MRNLKLTLSYDGTNYHGFQRQENAVTLQGVLEEQLEKVLQEKVRVVPAGRTDTGVHARGQVVNFFTTAAIASQRLPYALNSCLPKDIIVLGAEEVPEGFNARRSAKKKLYRYTIDSGAFPNVFWRYYAWHVHYKLDREALVEAGKYLLGTHDFTSFRAAGSPVKTSVRTISRLEWDFSQAPLWHLYIEANGFLYKMVRIIVGTLVEVARGKIPPREMKSIKEARDRGRAGPTAPAQGLFLWTVEY